MSNTDQHRQGFAEAINAFRQSACNLADTMVGSEASTHLQASMTHAVLAAKASIDHLNQTVKREWSQHTAESTDPSTDESTDESAAKSANENMEQNTGMTAHAAGDSSPPASESTTPHGTDKSPT